MAKKLEGAPTKLAKHKAATKKPARKVAAPKPEPMMSTPDESELKPRTFLLHERDILWLDQTVAAYRKKATIATVSKSFLIRLGIRLLQQENLDKWLHEG